MSDFLTADINELLHGGDTVEMRPEDKAYATLLARDREMISKFNRHDRVIWPEPVRKRHLR